MKTCPTCGNTFSRRVSFCFDDGTPLVGESEPVVPVATQRPSPPSVPAPRRGRRMLARRRVGTQPPIEPAESTAAAPELHPDELRPLGVTTPPRPSPPPNVGVTPVAAQPRDQAAPSTPVTPTPVSAPVASPMSAKNVADTPTPTPEPDATAPRLPRSSSDAPTLIIEPKEEDSDEAGWGMMLSLVLGVGVVVLVVLAIAVGLMWSNQKPQPAPAVAASPVQRPAPVAAVPPAPVDAVPLPEPTGVVPEPSAPDGSEPVAPEPVAPEPVAPELVAPEPVAPEPVTPEPVAAPTPTSDRVITVRPPSEPAPSPWTEVVEPASAPAPAPVASAPLSVNSTPSGAAVRVNGVVLGATPFRMTMPGGDYPIEITLDGYETANRSVTIDDAGGASVSVTLTPVARTGPILVTLGGWEGAELLVDGRLQGTLPARIDAIAEGSHTFTVRRDGAEQQFTKTVALNGSGMTVLTLGG